MAALLLLALTAWSTTFTKTPLLASETASGQQAGGFLLPGTGTEGDPWLIENLDDLEMVRQEIASGHSFTGTYIRLMTDIQLPPDWVGLGSLKDGTAGADNGRNILPFSGDFDGAGCKVTSSDGGYPLFAYVRDASIRNLRIGGHQINGNGLIRNYVTDYGPEGRSPVKTATVKNVTICSGTSTLGSGIVSGYAAAGNTVDIIGCTVEEGVTIGYSGMQQKIGSFGGDYNGTIRDCRSAATVCGTSYVGGIIGCRGNSMSDTSVTNCLFSGRVIATETYAGGIAGGGYGGTRWGINTAPNAPMLVIQNCLCTGTVEAADIAGGIEGYETAVQVWNDGHLTGNLFTGNIKCTDGTCIGGIMGKLRGIDRCNLIKDNYYSDHCGADRGIGGVEYVDTSCPDHETIYGETYFNTGEEVPYIPGVNDLYPNNLRPDYNRTDDPLGKDASALAKAVTDDEMADGTVAARLNQAEGSLENWSQGPEGPQLRIDPTITGIRIKSGYRRDYSIGESLDPGGLEFILSWSDNHEDSISGKNKNLTISGYDSGKQAYLDLTATYRDYNSSDVTGSPDTDSANNSERGKASVTFPVRILAPEDGTVKRVGFTLLGDRAHGPDADCGIHTRAKNNLEEWIGRKEWEAGPNDTAKDLILHVLEEEGLEYKDSGDRRYGSYCITGIQIPGIDILLSQFDNGGNSRWLYAVNGDNLSVDADRYFLKDGDEVILFYTDDFTLEEIVAPDEGENEDPAPPSPQPVDPPSPTAKIIVGHSYVADGNTYKVRKAAGKKTYGTVTFIRAKKAKKINVPATVKLADGRQYKVTVVAKRAFKARKIRKVIIGKNVKKLAAYAFAKSPCTTVVLKTKLLKKSTVRRCFKNSKVRKIVVRTGNKKTNKIIRKRYKKIFKKIIKNWGSDPKFLAASGCPS